MIKERLAFKLVSHLLSYPSDKFCVTFDEVIRLVDLVDEEVKPLFIEFLETIQWMDLKTWGKYYNETFDLNHSTHLNLTEYLKIDTMDRENELLSIQYIYTKEGFLVTKDDLPDYLPTMLEFASITQESHVGFDLLNQYRDNIEEIKAGLKLVNNFYVSLIEVISKTLEGVFKSVY